MDKSPGDKVFGATVNQEGLIKVQASGVGSDTALARIIRLVRAAQSSRPAVQRLADQVAAVFVPVIIAIALITFGLWGCWVVILSTALIRLVAVLVIACPCALGLATRTAVMVGIGKGAGEGILFKNSEVLETAQNLHTVMLDKTGTITQGKPVLTDWVPLNGAGDDALALAASAETGSEHPIAQAVVNGAKQRGLTLMQPDSFNAKRGLGLEATVDGHMIKLGRPEWFNEGGELSGQVSQEVQKLASQGKTVILASLDGKPAGASGRGRSGKTRCGRSHSRTFRDGPQAGNAHRRQSAGRRSGGKPGGHQACGGGHPA